MSTVNKQTGAQENGPLILRLMNSNHYYFAVVMILIGESGADERPYRLIVIHDNALLFDDSYATLRGAKIAFIRRYKDNSYQEGIKAHWSHAYNAEPVSIYPVMQIISKGRRKDGERRKENF